MDRSAEEWSSSGCRVVAGVVSAARALPSSALATDSGGYRKVGCRLQRRVCHLLERIWPSPLESLSQLESANDVLLERLERNFSGLEGRPVLRSTALPLAPPTAPQQAVHLLQSTRQPQPSKSRVVRPQLLFKDPVDNTLVPWKPRLKTKHNSIAPLTLEPVLDERGELSSYRNPYAAEIEAYRPPPHFLRSKSPLVEPAELDQTSFRIVDTEEELVKLIRHLNTVTELAVDLEHHSYRSFQGFTCLIQLSTEEGGDFVVDALALRHCLHRLNDPFTNPNILKVFHGADCDVIWLQRDFGVYIVGLFDTHRAAIKLGFSNKSLKNLLWKYCKKTTDKSLQLADWRVRPLPEHLCEYARGDTHCLLYIWRCMRKELLEADNGSSSRLLSVFEDSKVVCSKTFTKPKLDELTASELIRKSGKYFNSRQRMALNSLLIWRDDIARQEDESTGYVLPNHMILQIAEILPKETAGVLACCLPTPPLVLHHLNTIYQLVTTARTQPLVDEKPEATIEEIINPVKSIHIYNHQHLKPLPESLRIIETIRDLKKLKTKPSQSSLITSNEMEHSKTVDDINTLSFVPPFHRLLLVKKYNEITQNDGPKKQNDMMSNNIQVADGSPISNQHNNSADDEDVVLEDKDDSCAATKAHKFQPRHKTPNVESIPKESDNAKKSEKRKIKTDDKEFTPFDYKAYDYNSFNKSSFQHKKKRKFNKR